MLRFLSIFLLAAVVGLSTASVVMLCPKSSELCGINHPQHVTCDATGRPGPACPPGARNVPLSTENIQQIMDMHNKYRNQIAGGNLPGFSSAAKMNSLKWNQDLADYAGLNVLTCKFGHDCHNTPEFKYSGQNINQKTIIGNSVSFLKINDFIDESINAWWNEKDLATQANIDSAGGDKVLHFLQMAGDRVNQVGCAISEFTSGEMGKESYMVCNYSFMTFTGQAVYVKGAPTSQCQTGKNPNYQALCSVNEVVDNNKPI